MPRTVFHAAARHHMREHATTSPRRIRFSPRVDLGCCRGVPIRWKDFRASLPDVWVRLNRARNQTFPATACTTEALGEKGHLERYRRFPCWGGGTLLHVVPNQGRQESHS